MLDLVAQQAALALEDSLLLDLWAILQLALLGSLGALNRLLDTLQEIDDFVIHKILIYFHLLLKVSHLALVHQLKYPRAGVFNGLHIGLLQVEDLLADLGLELSVRLIVNTLTLQMKQMGLGLDEF